VARQVLRPPNLLDEDPLLELSLYVTRDGRVQIHHPIPKSKEDLIQYANSLLIASQVVAAQAGARIAPTSLHPQES
jgi:hypothetical protein